MESFLRQSASGIVDINIETEIALYMQTNGKIPTIIVDLLSLKSKIFESDSEILLGGRYNILVEKIRSFLGKLKLKANLVFFMDGPVQKTVENMREKNMEYSEAIGVLNAIYEGIDLHLIESKKIAQTPGFLSTLMSIAPDFGEVYRTDLNCLNLEMGNFASRNFVHAIISNNLDLLFFEGGWRLWSSNVDLEKMSTTQYKKDNIFKSLELSGNQRQLFGALAGNSILPPKTMKDFYGNVQRLHHTRNHFKGIIQLVKCLERSSQTLSSINLWILSRLIFPSSQQSAGPAFLKDSIDSYDHTKCVREYEDELKKEAAKSTFNNIILSNIPYVAELYYFDLSKIDFKPFYEIISPIIKRIMGILLYDTKMCEAEGKRSIFCKTSHDEGYKEISEIPEYPDCEVPKILTLLTEPIGFDPKLDSIRYDLICWALSKGLNSVAVQKLSPENLLEVLTLFYLCELKQITVKEADCILLSCRTDIPRDKLELDNSVDENLDELESNDSVDENLDEIEGNIAVDKSPGKLVSDYIVTRISGRDARIAFLFPVVRTYVKRVFRAVGIGHQVVSGELSFDGLCFHHLRKTWDTNSADSRKTLLKDCEKLRRLYADQFE